MLLLSTPPRTLLLSYPSRTVDRLECHHHFTPTKRHDINLHLSTLYRLLIPSAPSSSKMPSPETYDVTIIGGGPVGLLLAYQLSRFELSVCVVEKQDKNSPEGRYGRAITLFPRTLELLDQLDLVHAMLQQGFACRSSVTYKDGVRQQVYLSVCTNYFG